MPSILLTQAKDEFLELDYGHWSGPHGIGITFGESSIQKPHAEKVILETQISYLQEYSLSGRNLFKKLNIQEEEIQLDDCPVTFRNKDYDGPPDDVFYPQNMPGAFCEIKDIRLYELYNHEGDARNQAAFTKHLDIKIFFCTQLPDNYLCLGSLFMRKYFKDACIGRHKVYELRDTVNDTALIYCRDDS